MNTVRSPRSSNPAAAPVPWRWAMGGLTMGGLLALLVWMPAHWLTVAVSTWSQGHLQLHDARGSVWNGSAHLSLHGGGASSDAVQLPGRLRWSIVPGLNAGRPTAHISLRADCCTPTPWRLTLEANWQAVWVQSAAMEAALPLPLLAGLGTPWNTIDPQGSLLVRSEGMALHWALGRWSLHGDATLQTQDLSVRLSTLRPLGQYRLRIEGTPLQPGADARTAQQPPRITLDTLSGALLLQGQGQWGPEGLRFVGEARAQEAHQDALSNLLNIIGRREGARSIITLG